MTNNPLTKYFRQPQLYLRLPSGGKWYPAGSLEVSATGEYPVFSMTAKDELTLKTPDALLNGQATVDVIQSCIPNIKNAWFMPSVDLDAALIAIRQATYGNRLEITSVCPHCKSKNENDVDLGALSAALSCPDYNKTVKINDLEFFIRPQTYQQFNASGIETYEQQRLMAVVSNEQLDEQEKLIRFKQLFDKLLSLSVAQVSSSVGAIKTAEGIVVEDQSQIDEFFKNCEKDIWNAIKDHLAALGSESPLKHIPITCDNEECGKSYETPLVFEMSNFFG